LQLQKRKGKSLLRILHVAYVYPPTPSVADGITNVVYNVTRELAKRGHEVTVYTSDMLDLHGNDSLKTGIRVINGVTVYYLRSLWRHKTSIVTPSIIPLLSKKLSDFDVIHIHDCRSFQGISTFLFTKIKHVPYVFQPHGSYFSVSPTSAPKTLAKKTLDKLISDKIVRNALRIIALSQMEAEEYRSLGLSNKRIAIVPNGINLSEYPNFQGFGFLKRKFHIRDDSRILLYLGRIHETKGIDILIKAYAYMMKTMKSNNTLLVIAGPDDGYLAEIKSLAYSYGVSNSVIFAGFIDEKDKLSALADADLFITPTFYGFPMTFLETCAVGTPIVTTTSGDTLEWINNNVGYTTAPTYEELGKAMYTLISDDAKREVFSKKCKELARSVFSIEQTVDKLEQIYNNIKK
jgi:glycosyltransferase involved in cell wall biosynthesis